MIDVIVKQADPPQLFCLCEDCFFKHSDDELETVIPGWRQGVLNALVVTVVRS